MRNPQFQVKFQLQAVKAAGWLLAAALLRLLLVLLLANACETPPGSKTAWP